MSSSLTLHKTTAFTPTASPSRTWDSSDPRRPGECFDFVLPPLGLEDMFNGSVVAMVLCGLGMMLRSPSFIAAGFFGAVSAIVGPSQIAPPEAGFVSTRLSALAFCFLATFSIYVPMLVKKD